MGDNWSDKIKNTEVNPPDNTWNRIAASLDDSLNGFKFPVALYNQEVNPPEAVWNNIESALDKQIAPDLPLKKIFSISVFLKYAVAACFIGVLTYAGIKFFTSGSIKADTAVVDRDNKKSTDSAKSTGLPAIITKQPAQTETDTDEQALEQSKHTYAKLDMPSNHFSSKIKRSLYKSPVQLSSLYAASPVVNIPELQYSHRAAVNDSPASEADRYMMYKNSDGQFIRISKKLSTLYCCVSGEEQDNNCTDQLKKWREKLAASSFIPSPDNFMDILDLVNSLEDNRN